MNSFRIGNGFDVHKIVPGDGLYLGGVFISGSISLEGHSDADVLLHALTDALLGAVAAGDIGAHFPDSDAANKGRASSDFLKHAMGVIGQKGYSLVNADITVVCERPKVAPYRESIRENLALLMETSIDQVSVKGTTTEKLGFTGRGEGVAVWASVLLAAIPVS